MGDAGRDVLAFAAANACCFFGHSLSILRVAPVMPGARDGGGQSAVAVETGRRAVELPNAPELLLLAGDRLGRALAGARIGVRALAADRQVAAMTQAAIAAEVHQTLDVHRDFAAQIAFDDVVAVDGFADLQDFGVGQLRRRGARPECRPSSQISSAFFGPMPWMY